MREKSIKFFGSKYIIFVPLLIVMILVDTIFVYTMKTPIIVSTTFIYSVHAAQFTISALSLTVLAIITSSLSERYYGFSFKELLGIAKSDIGFTRVLIENLLVVGLSSILLAFNMVNVILILLLFTIFSIIHYSLLIIECLMNENFAYNTLCNSFSSTNEKELYKEIEKVQSLLN